MSAEPLACPYCNSLVPLPANAYEGQRLTCPRCGDTFPLRGVGDTEIQTSPGLTTAPASPLPSAGMALAPSPVVSLTRSRNRLTAGIILVVMCLMAATGLTYALLTKDRRRANDTAAPNRPKRPLFPEPNGGTRTPVVPPAQLEAIGYLPSHTNLILGVHVAQLLRSEAGKKQLAAPFKVGNQTISLVDLCLRTGLKVEEIDHFVVGALIENVSLPGVYAVARTLEPIDQQHVLATLKANQREGPRKGQVMYRFQFAGLGEAKLWFANKDTLVLVLRGGLEDVPEKPVTDLSHLPPDVRSALKERTIPGAVVWLVGAVEDWDALMKQPWFQALQLAVGEWDKDWLARIKSLQVLAVAARVDPEPNLTAAVRCTDAAAANHWRVLLLGPEDANKPKGMTASAEGGWLTLQWKGTFEAALKELGK